MRVRGRVVHGLFTQGQVDKGGKDIAWTAIPLTRFVLYGHPLAPSPPLQHLQNATSKAKLDDVSLVFLPFIRFILFILSTLFSFY
ncbi:hypothetical protein ACN38_g8605 [Penicillium nordicum]|uniref:Uncharacterized protein n=1 Tax=Penicillium nordicum TaxID=229535 RepID=A0A0M9WDD9_9EURO|nr:hypothetical protein ACN38_g8605 [Penicillium nordicum]